MARPRVLILRAPGTNCDLETAFAFATAGAIPERVHVQALREQPQLADEYQILCVPGGFSYGDDIAAGRILASQIQLFLADCLQAFAERGKLILGICNGFQVLLRTGLLIPHADGRPLATLTGNDSERFEDRWVPLRVDGRKCPLLSGIESLELPVAHAEGKFVTRDREVLSRLEAAGQLVLRYGRDGKTSPADYPHNPNGSLADAAGLCDATGRILGLMPHPERHIDPTHHPAWTRQPSLPESGAGLKLFTNAVEWFG